MAREIPEISGTIAKYYQLFVTARSECQLNLREKCALMNTSLILYMVLYVLSAVASAAALDSMQTRSGAVKSEAIALKKLDTQHQYSVLYSLSSLHAVGPSASLHVEIVQGPQILAAKTLHAGDPDFYTQFRISTPGDAAIRITNRQAAGSYKLEVNRWPLSPLVRSNPLHRWQDAIAIPLGETVFASGDDAEYIPLPDTTRKAAATDPDHVDWYRFDFQQSSPKLVFFQVELTERDQIPVNITLHRAVNGKLEEFYDGEDPVALPHEVQALPGNKFTPRLLKEQGTYYIAVRANHPEYKLRTRVYDPPPYPDPQTAVRTALDYILAAGDSWHANTPRRGGILDRTASVHQETSLCVACHATHFPQRAQLYAARNGYPVVQRQQLQFLAERFYNNPRPFFGFEEQGAVWGRMISAAANVLSRMSHLMGLYEEQITEQRRPAYHQGVAEYLKLYYADRDKLPPDETNGNTPLVSAHEVAWYSWSVTKDPRLPDFVATGEVKNTIDLCYQTLALADMDRTRFAEQIRKNAERILSLQRANGQWAVRFEASQPAAEFQTGHALWALHAAGIPASHPGVAKAIDYLLKRQQPFGGWMDPLQSYENFRTPFRETQMSVLALSAYFPKQGREKGWNSPVIQQLSQDPVELLQQLDNVWDRPSAAVLESIRKATDSPDALIRQAAVEALGRLGEIPDPKLLGDPSKMVQRTAAWATRQVRDIPVSGIITALNSKDDRTRWGATRIFAVHFADLAKQPELAAPLQQIAAADKVPLIQMDAIKALWQFWFWSPDANTKSAIEDSLLAGLGKPQHPWVRQNLRHAIYNVADENIRYLYNNWVPLLARQQDRDQVIAGRLAIEARLAAKFTQVLETGSLRQQKELLHALTALPLRRADVYDLEADLDKQGPPVYNRIGNDIEQIAFFGESAEKFAQALQPLLESDDAELRTLAARAVLLVRDSRFADVNRLAGASGPSRAAVMAKVDTMPDAVDVARALKPSPVTAAATSSGARPAKVKLDEAYFRGYVQPILEKRGKDGQACVHCHASHTLFNGSYATAMNVADPSNPEKSLILLKPTSTSESEGVVGAGSIAHGGGVRWAKDSPEYVTILEWIKGAKE